MGAFRDSGLAERGYTQRCPEPAKTRSCLACYRVLTLKRGLENRLSLFGTGAEGSVLRIPAYCFDWSTISLSQMRIPPSEWSTRSMKSGRYHVRFDQLIVLTAVALFFGVAVPLQSQANSVILDSGIPLIFGAGASSFNVDWGHGRMEGGTV